MDLATRIDDVVVYADRALVTRLGAIRLDAGTHQVRLVGLPASLVADSVRVSGAAAVASTLHGFDFQVAHTGEAATERVRQLEAMQTALTDRERALGDEREVHVTALGLVRKTAESGASGLVHQLAEGKAKLGEWEDVLSFLEARQKHESQAIQAIDVALRDVEAERQRLDAELWSAQSLRSPAEGRVTVTIELSAPAELSVKLEYVIHGASWSPAYDARLVADGTRLEWGYYGLVSQQTGEHWEDVALKLSTAQPAEGSRPPTAPEWFVSGYVPPKPAAPLAIRRREAAFGEAFEAESAYEPELLMSDMAPGGGPPAPPRMAMAAPAPVAVRSEGTSVTLGVSRRLTVPSHGEPHQAPIGRAEFPVKARYTAMPKLASHAFLEVEATQDGPWPLLPGPVKAYVGQDYVGTTPLLEDVHQGQTFWLPMGVDRAVQVKRQRLKHQTGESGMITKTRSHEYRYELTLTSYKDRAWPLRLIEPVPRSTQDDIKVKLGAATPPASQDEPGKLIWDLTLEPQKPVTVTWDYKIEHPNTLTVTGLE